MLTARSRYVRLYTFGIHTARRRKPLLSATLKKLWVQVHPDLFENHKSIQRINSESMTKLTEFLTRIKSREMEEAWPAMQTQKLDFHLRLKTPETPLFKKVTLTLSTNGGQCKGPVTKCFYSFFEGCGLPSDFQWDNEFWPTKDIPPRRDSE